MSANQKLLLLCAVTLGLGLGLGIFGSSLLSQRSESPRAAAVTPAKSSVPSSARATESSGWDGRLGSQPQFVDVTAESGIAFQHTNGMEAGKYEYLEVMGGGVAAFDYDQDGDLDLYFVNGNRSRGAPDPALTNRLYRNEGNLRFQDVTQQAGVGDAGYGQGCAAGDYDRDGDLDLYVTNCGPNVLYRNNGDGTFTDITQAAGVADDGWGQSVCFVDFDRDGHLDLLVQNYLARGVTEGVEAYITIGQRKVPDYPSPLGFPGAPSRLFQNQGDGTFRDVAQEAGLTRQDGKGMGLACVDLTGDGWPDVFLSNDTMENFLYRSRGAGRFEEIGHLAGVAYSASGVPEASMGVDVVDYDDDGDLDLIVPCLARQFFTLYRNDGTQFSDVSSMVGLDQATAGATGFDAHFLDYDNDADRDLFFTCGGVRMIESAPADASYAQRYGIPDLLIANDGAGRFRDVSRWAGTHFQLALIGKGLRRRGSGQRRRCGPRHLEPGGPGGPPAERYAGRALADPGADRRPGTPQSRRGECLDIGRRSSTARCDPPGHNVSFTERPATAFRSGRRSNESSNSTFAGPMESERQWKDLAADQFLTLRQTD